MKQFITLLKKKINSTSMEKVKADVRPFVRDASQLDIWSKQYFLDLAGLLKVEE